MCAYRSSERQPCAAGTPVDAALCRPAFLQQAASRRGATAPVLRKRMQRAVPAAPAATPESQSRPKMKQPAAKKAKLPTTLVAALLCAFSVTQALAAIASKGGQREYPYKVVASTLLSECFKIVCSAFFLMRELSTLNAIDRKRALQCTAASVATAAVPGVAYQVLNNLNFVTLYYVDAPTFQILGTLKIVATGLAGQVLLSRKLSRGKWLALTLLTIGAAVSQLTSTSDHLFEGALFGYASALICVFLSATMGVFTEAFMKGNKASIHFQNVQLYVFGILANLCALIYRNEIGPASSTSLFHGFNGWACVVVVANGSCGLAVSFLLRYADSIAKTYATALSIPATSLASYICFGSPIGAANVLGSGVMVISLVYYYAGAQLFEGESC